ncbi:hypothetical protein AB3515_13110 [Acinetobacter baumannii]
MATEQAWVQADNSVNVEDLIRAVKKQVMTRKHLKKNQDEQLDKKASELDQLKKI